MSCWSCKYESVRDGKPCQGCNHGRWWEPKDAPQPEQEVDPHAKLVDDLLAETAPKARQEQVAAPQGMYKAESIDGNQHNTGRVYTGAGSYFADAASFDKAKLIADALNAYSHPGPKAEPVNKQLVNALEESNSLIAAMMHEERPLPEIVDQMVNNRAAIKAAKQAK